MSASSSARERRRFPSAPTLAAVLALGIAGVAPAAAGDACKNVKFKLTNKHDSGETIIVKKVKYFNKANGRWQTEVVGQSLKLTLDEKEFFFGYSGLLPSLDKEKGLACRHGHTCTTRGDDLRDAEGEAITKVRFVFVYKAAGKWSGEVEGGDKEPDDPKCYAGRTYGPGDSGWAIFGKD